MKKFRRYKKSYRRKRTGRRSFKKFAKRVAKAFRTKEENKVIDYELEWDDPNPNVNYQYSKWVSFASDIAITQGNLNYIKTRNAQTGANAYSYGNGATCLNQGWAVGLPALAIMNGTKMWRKSIYLKLSIGCALYSMGFGAQISEQSLKTGSNASATNGERATNIIVPCRFIVFKRLTKSTDDLNLEGALLTQTNRVPGVSSYIGIRELVNPTVAKVLKDKWFSMKPETEKIIKWRYKKWEQVNWGSNTAGTPNAFPKDNKIFWALIWYPQVTQDAQYVCQPFIFGGNMRVKYVE